MMKAKPSELSSQTNKLYNIYIFICTKFSLERDGLIKFSTESNDRQPRGREEKYKNIILKFCNIGL